MAKFLFVTAFFVMFLGLQSIQAQSTGSGQKPDKPAPDKSLPEKVKEAGFSGEKTPGGGGGAACIDITKDVKVCIDKMGTNPSKGWGGHFTIKF